jgi:hypothetical protein
VKLTTPEKLLTLVTVMADVAEEPGLMLIALGLAVRTKSGVMLVVNVAV